MRPLQALADGSSRVEQLSQLASRASSSSNVVAQRNRSAVLGNGAARHQSGNPTGLPDGLRAGVEALSGISMEDVRVHYGSSQPAQLDARAYAQGHEIHVGPGQEQHLPHEAWHVVQQAQGRVRPTTQTIDEVLVNDDRGLEREADLMGQRALAHATSHQPPRAGLEAPPGGAALPAFGQQNVGSADVVQRERFVGDKAGHHLHIEIHQDHYKSAKDDRSRIEIGKNGVYKLDQLIVARNHLVDNNYRDNGGQACIDWLEAECESHADWDESVGYTPSWEVEEAEDHNPHVEQIMENASHFGYRRADFENSLAQARNEVMEEESSRVADENYYPEGTTAGDLERALEQVTVPAFLASWSGFPEDLYSRDDFGEYFQREAQEHLRSMLHDEFPLAFESGKYEYKGGLEG